MAILDWILVAFGAAVAFTGGWIQLHPERIYPRTTQGWGPDPDALAQIRMLGACFLFMGVFFALQMTIDLTRLPWWTGTVGGLAAAVVAVRLVGTWARQKRRRSVTQSALREKVLEVR